jgi:glycosyltransferase involved in cell wall biosynthesis
MEIVVIEDDIMNQTQPQPNTSNNQLPDKKIVSEVCLTMIVKNESHCILETLQNISKYIDYYIIVDTGSTDNTKEIIRNYFNSIGIKGEIYDEQWVDFGYNRSKALEYCNMRCKYALMMDADDLIIGDLIIPKEIDVDGMTLKFGTEIVYARTMIFRMDREYNNKPYWKYVGVLHEHPMCENPKQKNIYLDGDYYVESRRLGDRNRQPDKFKKDIDVFLKALEKEPDNSRYIFYLAQSYFDDKQFEKAIEFYEKRIEMKGWIEEVFFSQYNIAQCRILLNQDILKISNELMKAIDIDNSRAVPF